MHVLSTIFRPFPSPLKLSYESPLARVPHDAHILAQQYFPTHHTGLSIRDHLSCAMLVCTAIVCSCPCYMDKFSTRACMRVK